MKVVYNQFYKNVGRKTKFVREYRMVDDFVKEDMEHSDIGFEYDTEDEARTAGQCIRNYTKREHLPLKVFVREKFVFALKEAK